MDDEDEDPYFDSRTTDNRDSLDENEDTTKAHTRRNAANDYYADRGNPPVNRENGGLITRIRTTFASAPFGSLFQSNLATRNSDHHQQISNQRLYRPSSLLSQGTDTTGQTLPRVLTRERSSSTSSSWTTRTSQSQHSHSSRFFDDTASLPSSSTISTAPPTTPQSAFTSFPASQVPTSPNLGISIRETPSNSPRRSAKGKEPARPLVNPVVYRKHQFDTSDIFLLH